MRIIFFTIAISFVMCNGTAQTERTVNNIIADKFVALYNNNSYDSIFALFSSDMQSALPINKTREFFTGLKKQGGQVLKKEHVKYSDPYVVYKAVFEKGIFALNISVDDNSRINGLFIKPFDDNSPKPERNTTKLHLPFKGEWTVVWGGDTKEQNYHVESQAQKNAFDIVVTDNKGNTFKTDGLTNEDYYAFGKELLAPCDGEVVLSVDGIKDNKPGVLNPVYIPGNTVIIKTTNKEYLFFAHFKQNSIVVKQGEKVKQGELLGLCGNSGNSSEPHLHFHIQNLEDMNVATGVKCYFDNLLVNGQLRPDYSPVQRDKIKSE